MQLTGGAKNLKKLNNLFSTSSETTGREQSDIWSLIGQYAHEMSRATTSAICTILQAKPIKHRNLFTGSSTEMYHDAPDGLIGNEDCGQMSAWYAMSAFGILSCNTGLH